MIHINIEFVKEAWGTVSNETEKKKKQTTTVGEVCFP